MPELLHILAHALSHSLIEALKLVPFLYLTYLCMEWLERRTSEHAEALVARVGRAGPLVGGLLGVVPQCGFSAVGASLYAGRLISTGTLLAIFWSTSDEMLPLLLSSGQSAAVIAKILGVKVVVAVAAGFLVDAVCRLLARKRGADEHEAHIEEHCRAQGCACERHSLWVASLIHTAQIALAVFVVSMALHTVLELVGEDALGAFVRSVPALLPLLSGLVGLIPNCAASVALTQLYLEGVLTAGSLLSGLLVGAGVGLLVLLRVNRPVKDTLRLVAILFLVGAAFGLVFDALSLGAWIGI